MQSKIRSIIEGFTNQIVSFILSVMIYKLTCTFFGLNCSNNFILSNILIFSTISFVRAYVIRRVFNRFDDTKNKDIIIKKEEIVQPVLKCTSCGRVDFLAGPSGGCAQNVKCQHLEEI